MQTPSTGKSIPCLWGGLAHILAYNIFWFGIILALLAGHTHLPSFAPFALIPMLWLGTRQGSPLRPRQPEQRISRMESPLWFGGAFACALILLSSAYAGGVRGALGLLQAVSVGVASWAFLFITFRSCRGAIQRNRVA